MTILPQLERDLFNAADQRLRSQATASKQQSSPSRSIRARVRQAGGGLVVGLSIALAAAIAIVALVALHGRQAGPSTRPTVPSGGSPRAEMIRTFSVLRRPQTKADLDRKLFGLYLNTVGPQNSVIPPNRYIPVSGPASQLKRWGYPELDRRLARVERIPAWNAGVLIAPTSFQPSPSSSHRSEGLNLVLWTGSAPTIPPSSESGTGPRPTTVRVVLTHGLALANGVQGTEVMDGVALIPDRVESIELGPFMPGLHATLPGVNPRTFEQALAAIKTTARVHRNIAAFQLSMPTLSSDRILADPVPTRRGFALFGIGTIARATWFDASDHVIRHTTTDIDLLVRVQLQRRSHRLYGQAIQRTQFCRQNPHAC